jgi:hypothetical protein
LYTQGHRVTVGTAIALREDVVKEYGRSDSAEDEESNEDRGEDHSIGHSTSQRGDAGKEAVMRAGSHDA